STHPLARAITRYGKQQRLEPLELAQFQSVTGQGLCARRRCPDPQLSALHTQPTECFLGRRDWLAQGQRIASIAQVPLTRAGCSEIWLAEDELLGRIVLRDDIRPQARQVLEELRQEGLQTVVLTGDRKAAADH